MEMKETEDELFLFGDEDVLYFELIDDTGKVVVVYTMSDETSLNFWKARYQERERVFICNGTLMVSEDRIKIESENKMSFSLNVFPDFQEIPVVYDQKMSRKTGSAFFTEYFFEEKKNQILPDITYPAPGKALLEFPGKIFEGVKEVLLRIMYKGDIGYAFINGELINDNFNNGSSWDIGLMKYREKLLEEGLYLFIAPIFVDSSVRSRSSMAAWSGNAEVAIAEIISIEIIPVYEISF